MKALLEVLSKIKDFETEYRMSSEEMKRLWNHGKITETMEIIRWLMLLDIRDRMVKRTPAKRKRLLFHSSQKGTW
jgi:hypothetical protein